MNYSFLLLLTACMFASPFVNGQSTNRVTQFNIGKSRLAISGFDPVSYFSTGMPAEGKENITCTQQGIVYRFSSTQNRQAFLANPKSYEPQYGGWCAYAMGSSGEKVEVDPKTFKILNGKLYLFYNRFFNNTLKSWNKNESELMKKADDHWKRIFRE